MLTYCVIFCANVSIVSAIIAIHFATKALQYRDEIADLNRQFRQYAQPEPGGTDTNTLPLSSGNVPALTGSER